MVNRIDWREQNTVVAFLANIGGLDMRRVLADCFGTVVAAYAITGNVDVIKICRDPAIGRMTIIAGVPAGNMCRMFARGDSTVVTG